MIKRLILLSATILAASEAFAGDVDLHLRTMIDRMGRLGDASLSKSVVEQDGAYLLPCLVQTGDVEATKAAVVRLGGRVGTSLGNILPVYIPIEALDAISSREEVVFVEGAQRLAPKMDTARAASGVEAVQDGSALGVSYDGTNVIVGVIDDALDYGHPDFLGSGDMTRIQYIQQTNSSGSVVECTKRTIAGGTCQIVEGGQGFYHGTHVTGIAAGNDSVYKGVANNADIMFVFDNSEGANTDGSFATSVLDGVATIFAKADIMNKAAVINMSLGTSVGAHDGTSLLEQGLTRAVAGKRGRVLVGAAGNEQAQAIRMTNLPSAARDYVGGIHAKLDVADGESEGFRFGVWSAATAVSTYTEGSLVDMWLDPGESSSCEFAVFSYDQGRSTYDFTFPGLTTTDNSTIATGDIPFSTDIATAQVKRGGGIDISMTVDSDDERNGKARAQIIVSPTSGSSSSYLERYWFDVVVRASGGDCTGHMWLYYDHVLVHDFLTQMSGGAHDVAGGSTEAAYALEDGDSAYTMTIPATAEGVIAVGSWMPPKPVGASSSKWTGDNGVTYDQSDVNAPDGSGSTTGELSVFSSLGPTADGRTKPDVSAPGEPIISSLATDAFMPSSRKVGSSHVKMSGTSMASPHVAGIVALLLQRNNTLTVDEVKTALGVGAVTSISAKVSDDSWGAGKIDAATALGSTAVDTSAYSGAGDLDPPDPPDPQNNGGCTLADGSGHGSWMVFALLLLSGALSIRRRLSK